MYILGNFYRLLITFANSLDPDEARQNVWPDPGPNCLQRLSADNIVATRQNVGADLESLIVFSNEIFEKIEKKNRRRTKKKEKITW